MDNTVGSLTQLQRSIIIGTTLGDGYLRIVSGKKNALLEINHSYTQKEYVDWMHEVLKSLCKSGPKSRKGNGSRLAYRFNTRQSPELTELHTAFYGEGKKSIPSDLILDPIMLVVWFMDDGSWCSDENVYLNTQQFSMRDQERCKNLLFQMGIDSTLNRDKEYWRVRIKKSSLPLFTSIISPLIIPSMTYKIGL